MFQPFGSHITAQDDEEYERPVEISLLPLPLNQTPSSCQHAQSNMSRGQASCGKDDDVGDDEEEQKTLKKERSVANYCSRSAHRSNTLSDWVTVDHCFSHIYVVV